MPARMSPGILAEAEALGEDFLAKLDDIVGGFRSLDTMEQVLNSTEIELISLSRPLLREPDLPAKMKADPAAVSKCVSCNACYSSPSHRCIFRRKPV